MPGLVDAHDPTLFYGSDPEVQNTCGGRGRIPSVAETTIQRESDRDWYWEKRARACCDSSHSMSPAFNQRGLAFRSGY